jgi:SAM-dependent methyltransferase
MRPRATQQLDKLVETSKERYWNPEAWTRDQWVKAQAARLAPGSRVLDAGAGSSKYRSFFSHCRYETQDFCQYQGELVKYLKPIDHVCDITAIPLRDGALDAILCAEVLEHVTDPMAALAEFSRLLKPGGRLLLTAPHGTLLHMEPYHYYSGFTHFWYRHWLPRHRFEIESIAPQGGPGGSTVCYLQAFYNSWRKWEGGLSGPKRLLSVTGRMLAKIPVHWVLPRLLPAFDPHLDRNQICLGFMVAAIRVSEAPAANAGSAAAPAASPAG